MYLTVPSAVEDDVRRAEPGGGSAPRPEPTLEHPAQAAARSRLPPRGLQASMDGMLFCVRAVAPWTSGHPWDPSWRRWRVKRTLYLRGIAGR